MTLHTIAPVFDENSKILVLGSFPSVKSREEGFFYGHPQNRFWKVISNAFDTHTPQSIEEKKALLLSNGIALWDVIHSCDIVGSSDSSIKNVVLTIFQKFSKRQILKKLSLTAKRRICFIKNILSLNLILKLPACRQQALPMHNGHLIGFVMCGKTN